MKHDWIETEIVIEVPGVKAIVDAYRCNRCQSLLFYVKDTDYTIENKVLWDSDCNLELIKSIMES